MLTARQKREQTFYEEFSRDKSRIEVSLDPIAGPQKRPWNCYWYLFGRVHDACTPGAKLLDFGCGWGENSVLFAKMGYEVHGFDICEGNLEAARALAERYAVSEKAHFSLQAAEDLDYGEGEFDVVVGVDILHHVEIEHAVKECHRVLRSGGLAIFREPIQCPLFDTLRNSRLVRAFFPNDASLERHVTEDERKLTARDLKAIARVFSAMEVRSFRVFSRLDRFVPAPTFLEKVDYYCGSLPGYSRFRGTVVVTLRR